MDGWNFATMHQFPHHPLAPWHSVSLPCCHWPTTIGFCNPLEIYGISAIPRNCTDVSTRESPKWQRQHEVGRPCRQFLFISQEQVNSGERFIISESVIKLSFHLLPEPWLNRFNPIQRTHSKLQSSHNGARENVLRQIPSVWDTAHPKHEIDLILSPMYAMVVDAWSAALHSCASNIQ
jgi:hypothetical protein